MIPYQRTNPPAAWWELWPASDGNEPPPQVKIQTTQIDVRRFYAFPLASYENPLQSVDQNIVFVSPEDHGWTFISKEIRFGFVADQSDIGNFLFSCYDISANKTLFENCSPLNFSSWENGSIGFSYLLPYRHTLKFVFPSSIRAANIVATLVGELIRGVV